MKQYFNNEFLKRLISVIIYVPLVLLPLFYSNYVSIIFNLIFASIILEEIYQMKNNVEKKNLFNLYSILAIASFYFFLLLLITEEIQNLYLVLIISIIWIFDTFSYLGGKIIGGIKLMPKISSGKTVSGLIAGISMTLIATKLIFLVLDNDHKISFVYVLLIIVLSFIGDTTVSLLKRYASIKDSGTIMPGHGGLLDRFDSFIFVFLFLGISYLLT